MTSKKIVVCGIGTGVGKTIVSAILAEAWQADYWKPIQAGDLHQTDTDTVRSLLTNNRSVLHPEAYRLQYPMSPHASAEIEGITLDAASMVLPQTSRPLIIELAGGLMVPLDHHTLNLHLLQQWMLPVVLVSSYYLGSINHTLLSLEVLRQYQIPIAGIIFNGEENGKSREVILAYSKIPWLGDVRQETAFTREIIKHYATVFKPKLDRL